MVMVATVLVIARLPRVGGGRRVTVNTSSCSGMASMSASSCKISNSSPAANTTPPMAGERSRHGVRKDSHFITEYITIYILVHLLIYLYYLGLNVTGLTFSTSLFNFKWYRNLLKPSTFSNHSELSNCRKHTKCK